MVWIFICVVLIFAGIFAAFITSDITYKKGDINDSKNTNDV